MLRQLATLKFGWAVLAVAIVACGEPSSSENTTESSAPLPSPTLTDISAWPPEGDLRGQVVLRSPDGDELKVDFYLAKDGSYRFEDGRGLATYDFGSATVKSLAYSNDEADPDLGAVVTGHPLASPEASHAFLTAYLKWEMRGFCLSSIAASSGSATPPRDVGFLGLDAVEFTVAGTVHQGAESGPIESVTFVCDRDTGLPLSITENRSGQSTVAYEVLSLADATDPPPFDVVMPAGDGVMTRDLGFVRMKLEHVAAVVGYKPVVPTYLPPGFDLVEVTVAVEPEEGTTTGFGRVSPPSLGIVVLVYRNGISELVISSRLADPRPEIDDVWTDPYIVSTVTEDSGSAFAPSLRADFEVNSARESPTHGWALAGDLVVSVGGHVLDDVLKKVIVGLEQ